MKRFINDIKKFYQYTMYAARSELKSEVASSYLNWLWWILDPLLFMMVYTFIAQIVFSNKKIDFFPIYVFIGLSVWNFFNKVVISSVRVVKSNSAVVSKVYVPKYMLILKNMLVNGFKMMVSFGLVIIMMVIWRVPFSFKILYFIPLILILCLFTFGISAIVCHFGVFIEDLQKILTVFLKLIFYMSGVFYAIDSMNQIPAPIKNLLLNFNPAAFIMYSLRRTMLYSQFPHHKFMLMWLVIGFVLSCIGVRVIYKYENSYVKVI